PHVAPPITVSNLPPCATVLLSIAQAVRYPASCRGFFYDRPTTHLSFDVSFGPPTIPATIWSKISNRFVESSGFGGPDQPLPFSGTGTGPLGLIHPGSPTP